MSDWIGTVGGVVGLVVFLGAAVVYLRGSKDKGTITTLSASNDALIERVTLLEASEKRLKAEAAEVKIKHAAELAELNLRITACEAENARLELVRPSAEAIAEVAAMQQVLHEQITAHDQEVRAFMARQGSS